MLIRAFPQERANIRTYHNKDKRTQTQIFDDITKTSIVNL
jgi:hypothetical protein